MVAFAARIEPHFSTTVTAAGPTQSMETLADGLVPDALAPVVAPELRTDLRSISPQSFATFAHELYMVGELNWEEYLLTGFPSEMHPRFNETIGALTGEIANPNRPKDMLSDWEDRLDFLTRYQPTARRTQSARCILDVLSRYHRADVF